MLRYPLCFVYCPIIDLPLRPPPSPPPTWPPEHPWNINPTVPTIYSPPMLPADYMLTGTGLGWFYLLCTVTPCSDFWKCNFTVPPTRPNATTIPEEGTARFHCLVAEVSSLWSASRPGGENPQGFPNVGGHHPHNISKEKYGLYQFQAETPLFMHVLPLPTQDPRYLHQGPHRLLEVSYEIWPVILRCRQSMSQVSEVGHHFQGMNVRPKCDHTPIPGLLLHQTLALQLSPPFA